MHTEYKTTTILQPRQAFRKGVTFEDLFHASQEVFTHCNFVYDPSLFQKRNIDPRENVYCKKALDIYARMSQHVKQHGFVSLEHNVPSIFWKV